MMEKGAWQEEIAALQKVYMLRLTKTVFLCTTRIAQLLRSNKVWDFSKNCKAKLI